MSGSRGRDAFEHDATVRDAMVDPHRFSPTLDHCASCRCVASLCRRASEPADLAAVTSVPMDIENGGRPRSLFEASSVLDFAGSRDCNEGARFLGREPGLEFARCDLVESGPSAGQGSDREQALECEPARLPEMWSEWRSVPKGSARPTRADADTVLTAALGWRTEPVDAGRWTSAEWPAVA